MRSRAAALRWLTWSTAAVALLALPWHIHAFVVHGAEFFDTYVTYEMLGRLGSSTLRAPGITAWVPIQPLWQSFLPWSPLLFVAAAAGLAGWPGHASGKAEGRLLATYAVLILGLFALLPSKWPWYGVPAYPALAVLGAVFVSNLLRAPRRWIVPLLLALLLAARLLFLEVDDSYAPASRAAWAWPGQVRLYFLSPVSMNLAAWAAVVGALILAALPALKAFRSRAWVAATISLFLAAALFGISTATIAGIPREHECATSKLVRTLERRGIKRLLTMGFTRDLNYGNRSKPLTSVYFLGLRGAEVIDCVRQFECLTTASEQTALVIPKTLMQSPDRGALIAKLRTLATPPEVWVLDLKSEGGFEPLAWR